MATARLDYSRPNVAASTLERMRARSRTSFNEVKGAPGFAGRILSTSFRSLPPDLPTISVEEYGKGFLSIGRKLLARKTYCPFFDCAD